jgi:hypothetical protein
VYTHWSGALGPKFCFSEAPFRIQETMMDLERIRQRAYELWEQDGRPEGRQQEHWDRAVREIEGEGGGAGGGNLSEAAEAMRGLEGGTAEGTDADQFGTQRVKPGVQTETGGGA